MSFKKGYTITKDSKSHSIPTGSGCVAQGAEHEALSSIPKSEMGNKLSLVNDSKIWSM
jgi:hypothetical protein